MICMLAIYYCADYPQRKAVRKDLLLIGNSKENDILLVTRKVIQSLLPSRQSGFPNKVKPLISRGKIHLD